MRTPPARNRVGCPARSPMRFGDGAKPSVTQAGRMPLRGQPVAAPSEGRLSTEDLLYDRPVSRVKQARDTPERTRNAHQAFRGAEHDARPWGPRTLWREVRLGAPKGDFGPLRCSCAFSCTRTPSSTAQTQPQPSACSSSLLRETQFCPLIF
jgi:hypothetical protein